MRLYDLFYSVATGSRHLRLLLTPVGLFVFFGMLLLVVFGSLYMDEALEFPRLLSGPLGTLIGVVLLAIGLIIWAWCVVWFTKAKGTPVPFNPPCELYSGSICLVTQPDADRGLRLFIRDWVFAPFCIDGLRLGASVCSI